MNDRTYARARGVMWRIAADRVLVHRVGVPAESAAFELTGPVVLAWVALDEPGTLTDVAARLAESVVSAELSAEVSMPAELTAALADDLDRLADLGLVTATDQTAVPDA